MFLLPGKIDVSQNSPSTDEVEGGYNGGYQPAATTHANQIHQGQCSHVFAWCKN